MFAFLFKKIMNLKNTKDLDGRFWIQRALLIKNLKKNSN